METQQAITPRFDSVLFREGARVITLMKAGVADVDLSPVTRVSEYLKGYGKTFEEFDAFDPVTKCLLRAGAGRISRCPKDTQLFAVVQEMIGSTKDIRNANGKLERTHTFLAELGRIGSRGAE